MKKFFCSVIAGIIITVSVTAYSDSIQSDIAQNILRLHILANSDSEEDQKLKLQVRDRLLREGKEIFDGSVSAEDAERLLAENREKLLNAAQDEIEKLGYDYDVTLKTGEYDFPAKEYGNIILPAGTYRAVRVEIGKAEGKNWWCVMFPPLCFVDASVGVADTESMELLKNNMSDQSFELIADDTPSVEVRFKIVDFMQNSARAIKTAFGK